MSKYFDLEKLKGMVEAKAKTVLPEHASAFLYIANWFNHLPAADVEPVRHGHWKHEITEIGIPKLHYIVCSKCLKGYNNVDVFWLYGGTEESFNYCPQRGAKMDGEENE